MLFAFEPLKSNRPSSGFSHWMPSRALGVAGHLVGGASQFFVEARAPVVQPVDVTVLEGGDIEAGIALPGLVELHGHVLRDGLVQDEGHAVGPVDQPVVKEWLEARADVVGVFHGGYPSGLISVGEPYGTDGGGPCQRA